MGSAASSSWPSPRATRARGATGSACRRASSGGSRGTSRSTPPCRRAWPGRLRISVCVPASAFGSVADAAAALAVAVALDLLFGDPPNRLHPVAWMGGALGVGRRGLCRGGRARLLVGGAVLTLAVAGAAALGGEVITALAARLGMAAPLIEGAVLSLLLSLRGLVAAARGVAAALAGGDLDAARVALAQHLVSRPTATLARDEVASAVVESVAENLTDAFVAPLCFYLAFGLAGAAAYRAVNTADAMIGYRDGALEWFGKVAARLDDALNFVPARLAAAALVVGAAFAGENARAAVRVLWRDGARTASPNAGLTMAAVAGALGLTLAKRGAYRLGDGRAATEADVSRAVRVFAWAAALTLGALLVLDSLAFFLRGGPAPLGII
ncbi:MAG: cobalamin biosynthesis protein CobD [Candidatus Rokuibacteriota bacterium]|nr:MAG: cobalamin biosynthesis protein CobD [Candidatus Rokubacteria bacterium]